MFSYKKFKAHISSAVQIPIEVRKDLTNDNGVKSTQFVMISDDSISIPGPEDYRLSNLLESGVPLQSVDTKFDSSLTVNDVNMLTKIVESTKNE